MMEYSYIMNLPLVCASCEIKRLKIQHTVKDILTRKMVPSTGGEVIPLILGVFKNKIERRGRQ